MVMNWTVSEIDLSDAGFWGRPFDERDAAFRAEIRAMFQALFTRMPDLQVTGTPQWLRSSAINGIKHLPVRFTPSRRGG